MAKWDFKIVGASFVKELVPVDGDVNPRSESFMQPSFDLEGGKIVMKESGQYKTAIYFSQIGKIDGVAPTDIEDAYAKLLTLVENFNGGGGTPQNLAEVLAIGDREVLEVSFDDILAGTGNYNLLATSKNKVVNINSTYGENGTITVTLPAVDTVNLPEFHILFIGFPDDTNTEKYITYVDALGNPIYGGITQKITDKSRAVIKQLSRNNSYNITYLQGDSLTGGTAYTFGNGIANTAGTVTNNLSTGVVGGQNIILGTGAGDGGIIYSTSNPTKGNLFFNPVIAGATVGTVTFGSDIYNPAPISGDAPHMFNIINNGTNMQVFQMYSFGSGAGVSQNNFHATRARGTASSPLAVALNDFVFSFGARMYDGTTLGQSAGAFQYVATENQTAIAHGIRLQFQGTAKGSTTRVGQMVLDSNGLSIGNPISGDNAAGVTLDVWGGNFVNGADDNLHTRTNATNKVARYLTAHYTNTEEAVATILNSNTSTANSIFIGGGSGLFNSATQINFYTAANNTTLTGSSRGNINSAGNWFIGAATSAVATLEILAGTTSTAPLKLNAGTNRTTPQDGAVEFDGTNLYFTVGGVRKTVTLI